MTRTMIASVFATASLALSCNPDCLRLRLEYTGNRTGEVLVAFRHGVRSTVYRFPDVASALRDWSGQSCPVFGGTPGIVSRAALEAGATMTAWIDVGGGDAARCAGEMDDGGLGPTCGPDPGEPRGSLPTQPFPEVITIRIEDDSAP